MGVHLISHDVPGDGRGLNIDWVSGDEAALLDISRIQENTDPTLRGTNKRAFEKSRYFGSRFYTSSTPLTPEGMWFTEYEEKAMVDPQKINFISATCEHNLHNLRDEYLDEAEQNAYAYWVFEAEYKNVRPKFTKDAFYPLLDPDTHCYNNYDYNFYNQVGKSTDCRGDSDLVKGQPLILGIDWGAAINCLTVNQHLRSLNEFRTLKSMYVLGSEQKIQDDLFDEFHAYYQHHNNKQIYLHYDKTGNHHTGNTRYTRAQQARARLEARGWQVRLMTVGSNNPQHERKHMLWNMLLREELPYLPRYRMNKSNCKELYASMRHAKAIPGRNGEIRKDKSSEKSSKIPRQEATDLSDANDTPIFHLFHHLMRGIGGGLPGLSISSK